METGGEIFKNLHSAPLLFGAKEYLFYFVLFYLLL